MSIILNGFFNMGKRKLWQNCFLFPVSLSETYIFRSRPEVLYEQKIFV